ncbi:HAD-IIB family hydrolase [Galbitalea soli]|uniref:phosphomannomutase n=1 Tax=Galbitalea soli TaxID=1268042 RepID=A0A7C9PP53_9MICO|nr:HAD-IIB family hydrolase [Galbitalea soli]NEM92070.1 HAD-IIB family hydrolase [Galbitalea soli]NYJ31978.1 hypothetical protein [Galbitalea soli]
MTSLPRLLAFDLDDTLAPSKSPIPAPIAALLTRATSVTEVCIISGGDISQFTAQVISRLDAATDDQLSHLHLMPTCGTRYYRHRDGEWAQIYAQDLTDDEKSRALAATENTAKELGLWAEQTWGPILEDRGSQITFSALGQQAPVDEKVTWDPTGEKKGRLRDAIQELLPDLEVRSGGSTSIDITRKGVDKAYGMTRLAEVTGIPFADMVFVGDRLDEGGNDYPVKALGVPCVAVDGWEETVEYLTELLG